ncbi:MAG: tetratricopeptide repeat protein [Candidatus Thiodiazotropha sp.]
MTVTKGSLLLAVGIFLLLLLPGRIIGYQWRDLIAGRRLLDSGRHAEAITLFERFLADIRGKRWLKTLIWLAPSLYTTKAEAMTLNNLGVCQLELGDFETAQAHFEHALSIDPKYPMPHYNLAILEMYQDRPESSERHLSEAVRLGFKRGSMDKVIQKSKSIYARMEPMARHTP